MDTEQITRVSGPFEECWNQPSARWYYINDTFAKEVPTAKVMKESAYMPC